MGNQRELNPQGGFTQYLYETVGAPFESNGLKGKVIRLKTDPDGMHSHLPQYANTSDIYLRLGADGQACQARIYIDRRMYYDLDWGHTHVNRGGDGRVFEKGIVHVQIYEFGKDGRIIRHSRNARLMTDKEIEKYGAIIHHFNSNVRFM